MNSIVFPTRWLVSAGVGWLFTTLVHAQPATSPSLAVVVSPNQNIDISWPAAAEAFVLEQNTSLGQPAYWQTVTQSPVLRGDRLSVTVNPTPEAQFYRLRLAPGAAAFTLSEFTPLDGATEVGVTFRPRISFSQPVNPATLGTNNFYASFGGQTLPATIVPANDGSFAWLFIKQPMPGGARVRITVDGSSIIAAQGGSALDATGAGTPGGVLTYDFTTVSLAPLAGTSLSGIVVDPGPDLIPRSDDDLRAGPDGRLGTADDVFLLPIEGVKVYLLGREDQVVMTGPDGRFHFDAVPGGDVKVVVDGNTASHPPAGRYFPEMVIDAPMVVGVANHTMTNGPEVYLPRLAKSILLTVSGANTNLIQATPDGAPNLSAFQRRQLSIEIAPDSFIGPDGRPLTSGQVGISTVPAELVRDMLPPGVLQHTFDITIQAPGIAMFATPAPMSFPNVFNASPGTKLNFLSFDHTTGRLVIEGTATVSADGARVRTDPGTGVTHPGWHGLTPPGGPNDPPCDPMVRPTRDVEPIPLGLLTGGALTNQPIGSAHLLFVDDDGQFVLSFGNAAGRLNPNASACDGENAQATRLRVRLDVLGGAKLFLDGINNQTFDLAPGQTKDLRVKMRPFRNQIPNDPEFDGSLGGDRLYYVAISVGYSKVAVGGTVELLSSSPPLLYVYRYVDAMDLGHEDGIIEYAPTLNDGPKGIVRSRPLVIVGYSSYYPTPLASVVIPADTTHFHSQMISSSKTTKNAALIFDPQKADRALRTELRVWAPDGKQAGPGTLYLQGEGVEKFRLNVHTAELTAQLKEVAKWRSMGQAPSPQKLIFTSTTADGGATRFTLASGGESTPPLRFASSADEIKSALEKLAGIGAGNVEVALDQRQFAQGGRLYYQQIFTLSFPRGFAGTRGPIITVTPGSPFASIGPLYEEALITDLERNRIQAEDLSSKLTQKLQQLFTGFAAGIEVVDSPGPNSIDVIWEQGGVRGRFGSSTIPGGVGIDNSLALQELIAHHSGERWGLQRFRLAKALNQLYPANIEIYPNQILAEYLTAPLELSSDQIVNALAACVAHEAAHTLGALHTAGAVKRTVQTNEVQRLTRRADVLPADLAGKQLQFNFGGARTALMAPNASAQEVEDFLQGIEIVEPEFLGTKYVKVTGNRGGPWTVTFIGRLSGVDVPELDIEAVTADSRATGLFHTETLNQGAARLDIKAIRTPGISPAADLMAGGILPFDGLGGFQKGLSAEVLKMGLKLDWTEAEAQTALRIVYAAPGISAGLSNLEEVDGGEFLVPEPHLDVETGGGELNPRVFDFGVVVAENGSAAPAASFLLRNLGAGDLTLQSVRLVGAASAFKLTPVPAGTVIPPSSELTVEVSLDPAAVGEQQATLEIESSDPQSPYRLDLHGVIQSPKGAIRVLAPNNNLGGRARGAPPVLVPQFATITNVGAQALTITGIKLVPPQAEISFNLGALPNPWPLILEPGGSFTFDLSFQASEIGLQRGTIAIDSNDPATPTYRVPVVGTGLPVSDNPLDSLDYGNDFVAMESPDFPEAPILRAKSDANGNFQFFLPPGQRYHAVIFDPVSGLIAHLHGITAASGQNTQLGTPVFLASMEPDSDGDGLPDDVELAIGTDPHRVDTDGDGLDDFAAVQQGVDPLGGRAAVTGIIGQVPLGDWARDVAVLPNSKGDRQLAYLAANGAGFVIVDVTVPSKPTLIGRLALEGSSISLSVDPATQMALVSGGAAIHLLDVSDPAAPKLTGNAPFYASCVGTRNGYGYFQTGARLRAVNLRSGEVDGEVLRGL